MSRVYNFSAGPAVLPEEVLKEAADEMLDYKGTGMSVMEMSHRSKAYDTIIKEAEQDLRRLRKLIRKLSFTVKLLKLLLLLTKLSHIFQTALISIFQRMQTTFIYVKIIPFTVLNLRLFLILRARSLLLTFLPASFQNRLT